MSLPSWPQLDETDVAAVTGVLRSNKLSQLSSGLVPEFEAALAAYHRVPFCVAVNSGTAAVHLALRALDIGPGDEVIVPAHTFVASATPVLFVGADPVFADVDRNTYCVTRETVEDLVTPRTKAIIAVHLNGMLAPTEDLISLTDATGIALIEDAAQAIGARDRHGLAGTRGVMGCHSFWEDKILTTGGEGGAIVTRDPALDARLRILRHHGEEPVAGQRLYKSFSLGYNYRLTAMQAALGLSQLARLDHMLERRRDNARLLQTCLADIPSLTPPRIAEYPGHANWKFVSVLDSTMIDLPTHDILELIRDRGVPALPRYPVPLHKQPVLAGRKADCPTSEFLALNAFSLPVHPAILPEHVRFMADTIRDVCAEHAR